MPWRLWYCSQVLMLALPDSKVYLSSAIADTVSKYNYLLLILYIS